MLRKLPIVGVFGQGTPLSDERAQLARDAGALVATLGAHLLTGGGYGVMAAAAEGFVAVADRPGLSIGIVPRAADGPMDLANLSPDGRRYPNPFSEIAIMTPLLARVEDWRNSPGRNHVKVFTADVIIALPGGTGTRNELDMAATYGNENARPRNERRTILIGPIEEFTAEHRAFFPHAETLKDAERHLRAVLASRNFTLPTDEQPRV